MYINGKDNFFHSIQQLNYIHQMGKEKFKVEAKKYQIKLIFFVKMRY